MFPSSLLSLPKSLLSRGQQGTQLVDTHLVFSRVVCSPKPSVLSPQYVHCFKQESDEATFDSYVRIEHVLSKKWVHAHRGAFCTISVGWFEVCEVSLRLSLSAVVLLLTSGGLFAQVSRRRMRVRATRPRATKPNPNPRLGFRTSSGITPTPNR